MRSGSLWSHRCPLLSPAVQNVILSSQSAATVKKDTLSQPALEVQETSSQESSLESETDEEEEEEEEDEEEEYMDVWAKERAPPLSPPDGLQRSMLVTCTWAESGVTEIWDRLLWPGQAAFTTCSRLEMFTLNCFNFSTFFIFHILSFCIIFCPEHFFLDFLSIRQWFKKRTCRCDVIKSKYFVNSFFSYS